MAGLVWDSHGTFSMAGPSVGLTWDLQHGRPSVGLAGDSSAWPALVWDSYGTFSMAGPSVGLLWDLQHGRPSVGLLWDLQHGRPSVGLTWGPSAWLA